MPKVLISDPISDEGVERLRESYAVDIKTELTEEELASQIGEYDAIIVRSGTQMTPKVIENADSLKIIGRAGVGVDNIDIDAATQKGIIVANAPEGNTVAAAEHAVTLMLSMARNIPQAHDSLKDGEWRKSDFIGVEVNNKTLGVLGLGRIGGQVAKRASKLGMDLVAFDPYVSESRAEELGAELASMEEVLRRGDFITVHTPLTDETHHMISHDEVEIMQDHARLVHASRGGVVDEEAIADGVESGEIAGAAFDVFEEEPPKDSPLLGVEDIIVTPHLGASTEEAQRNVATSIVEQVIDVLEGGVAENALNAPAATGSPKMRAYANLAETLGKLTAQITDTSTEELEIEYSGEIADEDTSPLTVSVQKGMLEPILDDPVNFVNAPVLAEERGVKVTESKTGHTEDFVSLVSVTARTEDGDETKVEGTLFGKNEPRIVYIDDYRVDALPHGHMLVIHNEDRPGMIGRVGSMLGEHGINIAGMFNARESSGGEAIIVLNVDSEVSREVRDEITSEDGIKSAKYVSL
ncbi:phosphoglycerate dehydrogenase [Halorutilales archaeon Cl-col2-1]